MYCMKCGREIKDHQVFCQQCLEDMAKNPVKPGTPVQLPVRPASNTSRRSAVRKKAPSAEEQLKGLRGLLRGMALGIAALILALGVTVSALVHALQTPDSQQTIGQNYITATPTDGN